MYIQKVKLKQFRNYDALELKLVPGVNLFFGSNGSGKTNLLEAVHYCALGRSHRTTQDREVIARDKELAACGVTLQKRDGLHEVAVKLVASGDKRKQVFIDGKRAARLAGLMGTLQCVIFSPEDLDLVKDGPSVRRRFLDMLLSQLSTSYFTALQSYQQALSQRNMLLRALKFSESRRGAETMDLWEDAMAKAAAIILPARRDCCERLAREAAKRYRAISGRDEEQFSLSYLSCIENSEQIGEHMASQWAQRREEDIRRGTTTFGLHREDIGLMIRGKDMRLFASQGQIRTAALALKLSELSVFQELAGEPPVLLLDDVMSELDLTRRTRLLDEIRGVQTLITCTDESDLGQREKYYPLHVSTNANGFAQVEALELADRKERMEALDDSFLDE